jgi:signal transduction histidine kinase
MPAGGALTIAAAAAGGCARITITDSGSGIDPELLPRIFEPWVTTKPAGKGTGLGLSITRDVIARHAGTITAESTPGRTQFTIVLPVPESQPLEEHG